MLGFRSGFVTHRWAQYNTKYYGDTSVCRMLGCTHCQCFYGNAAAASEAG